MAGAKSVHDVEDVSYSGLCCTWVLNLCPPTGPTVADPQGCFIAPPLNLPKTLVQML